MNTKTSLRQHFLQKRLALDHDEIQLKNEAIYEVLKSIFSKIYPDFVHTFLPRPGKNEVDNWKLVRWLSENLPETKILAPYVVPGTREMEHYILDLMSELISNQWQIPEPDPITSEKVSELEIDIVLVPLLTFDKNGFRVGYGGGYYDRFLEKCRPETLKIGLSFFDPIDKIEDLDGFDIPLNMCITPEYIYRF